MTLDLLHRLEAGETSAQLDGDYALAMGWVPRDYILWRNYEKTLTQRSCFYCCAYDLEMSHNPWIAPSVSSLDAMLAKAREMWPDRWIELTCMKGLARAWVYKVQTQYEGRSQTPSRALAAAMLRAKMEEGK